MKEYFIGTMALPSEPTSYSEAVGLKEWQQAMDDEIDSIHRNGTWILTTLPPGKAAISTKWVFKQKQGADGRIIKCKARLVARDFQQRQGLDYEETFAPVVKWGTLRALLALAAHRHYPLYHLDVKTAFLHGHLAEEVYTTQPQGYEVPEHEHLVCRLSKALYGLRQAPRAWYERIDSFLVLQNFHRGVGDSNLYILQQLQDLIIIALYVDDLLLIGSSVDSILSVKQKLETTFEMSDIGDGTMALYLKAEIIEVPKGIFMTQWGYCKQILETFGMTQTTPVTTPMLAKPKLFTNMEEDTVDPTLYRSMVGKLLYLTHTQPDITHAVSVVSRFMPRPQLSHLQAVKRIFRYLSGTCEYGILFARGGHLELTGFSDSDYAGDPESGRSTTGFVFFLGGSPITWFSKKQPTVAISSCKAEYRSMSEATRETVWLNTLLDDFGVKSPEPALLHCDNESSIKIARNPVFHSKTKHITVHYHFTREKLESGEIRLTYIPTGEQVADLFTKPLGRPLFEKFRTNLQVMSAQEAGLLDQGSNHRSIHPLSKSPHS
jgi:hypothetical protein